MPARMRAGAVEELEHTLRARQDDPALWHAYSDWLTEHGDTRGELIRLEQRLARTRPADRPALQREIADFVTGHEQEWDDDERPAAARVLQRRHGFVTAVSVEWSDEIAGVVRQALRGRFVSALKITPDPASEDYDNYDDADAYLDREGLDLGPFADVDLGGIVELDLSYLYLGPGGAEGLAASLRTDRLRRLDARYCRIRDAGLAALAVCPQLGGLRRLHLQRNDLTAEGVRALHQLPELTELDLRYNGVGPAGARALLAAPFAGSLTRLWLYGTDVGPDGVRILAQSTELPIGLRNLWRCV